MVGMPRNTQDNESDDNETETRQPWPIALLALSLGSFAIGTTEFLPAALLPTIASDLNVSLTSAGLLISGYAMGVTVMTPLLTALFAGRPRKPMLIGLMALFVLTNGLAALAPGYPFLLTMRFLTAFSHGVYFAFASTAAASLVARGRGARAIAILFSGLTIAMATVVPAGALLGQILGWRMAFALTAMLGVLTVLGIALTVPPLPRAGGGLSLRRQVAALKEPHLLLALAMTAVGYGGTMATFSYLSALLEQVSGFKPTTVTILFAVLGVGVTIGNLLGGRVADFGLHRAIVAMYALVALSLLVLWLCAPTPLLAVPALVFFSIVMFGPGAGLQMHAVEQGKRFLPGAEDVAAGLNQSAFNLGIAFGAFVGGQVVASPLGLAGTPLVSVVIVLVAIGLTLVSWRMEVSASIHERMPKDEALDRPTEPTTANVEPSPATY